MFFCQTVGSGPRQAAGCATNKNLFTQVYVGDPASILSGIRGLADCAAPQRLAVLLEQSLARLTLIVAGEAILQTTHNSLGVPANTHYTVLY